MPTQTTMNVKILQATKTTAEWSQLVNILDRGLLCVELTPDGQTLIKVGDGLHTYAALPYVGTSDVDMNNYYTKGETNAAIANAISEVVVGNIKFVGVVTSIDQLPSEATDGDMYLVGPRSGTTDTYDQYVRGGGAWVHLGTRQSEEIDLSNYATITDIQSLQNQIDIIKIDQNPHMNRAILDQIDTPFTQAIKDSIEAELSALQNVFTGATAADPEHEVPASAGTKGLVPAPQIGDENKFLRGDGTWSVATGGDPAVIEDLENRVETLEEVTVKSSDDLLLMCIV